MGAITNLTYIVIIELAVAVWIAYVWIAFKLYGNRKPRRWVYWMVFLMPMAGSFMLDWGFGIAISALGICVWWGLLPMERHIFGPLGNRDPQRLAGQAKNISHAHRGKFAGRLDGVLREP